MTIATETRLGAQNQFFCFSVVFFLGKNLLLHMVMLEKVANRGFLAFGHLKMGKNLEKL